MKKLICLLLAALLLCGCQPAQQIPTDDTTVPTVQTNQPSTETNSPETTEPSISTEQYEISPEGFFPFVFDGHQPYQGFGPEIDLTGLELGHLYIHDESEDKIYPISHQPVAENGTSNAMTTTKDHVYFVLASDPTALIRTDYFGQDWTVVYRSEYGPISCVDYHGTDPFGKVGLVENANRFILYDLSSGNIQVMLEQPYIKRAYYHPNDPSNRPYIRWYGRMEGDTDIIFCLYYLDNGEFDRRENW